MAIHPGDILAGYRVTRLLGRGGMGEVWAAVDDQASMSTPGPPLEVAIKVLLARAAMKPDLVRRFEREARIASAIKSPFVCQLIEVANAPDGSHLLVFEHLSGESLADRLKREQYLPLSEVGPIIDDVLEGLTAAHDAGVIHRDLKPGNIFLVESQAQSQRTSPGIGGPLLRGGTLGGAPPAGPGFGNAPEFAAGGRSERAKILDFGISKLRRTSGHREPTLTAFDATLGSFAYMAPEQVRGAARADERADIYAVGAVAFRALSGRLPFEGNSAAVLVAMKLDRSAPSLAQATSEQWPAGIERFLERALERDRDLRFATAAEALEVWRSIQPSAIPRAASSPSLPDIRERVAPPSAHSLPAVSFADAVPASSAAVRAMPPRATPPETTPRSTRAPGPPSAVIPAPTKPVVTVYAPRPPSPSGDTPRPGSAGSAGNAPGVPPPIPAPRPPMQSYQVVEDNPTEVDGPPTMTIDGSFIFPEPPPRPPAPPSPPAPRPPDSSGKRRTGRR